MRLLRNLDNYENLPAEWLRSALEQTTPGAVPGDPGYIEVRGPETGKVLAWNDLNLLGNKIHDSATIATDASPTTTDCILPPEVLTMYDLMNDQDPAVRLIERNQAILGIQSVNINVSIDYSELDDIGLWRGASQDLEFTDDYYGSSYTNDKQKGYLNQYRYVNLPVQVTTSFTGVSRQQYPSMALFEENAVRGFPVSDITFSRVSGIREDTNVSPTYYRRWHEVGMGRQPKYQQVKLDWSQRKMSIPLPSEINNYYVWDLGQRNYLVDINTSGGSTGGDNVEVTMSYQNDCSDIVIVKDTDGVKNLPYPETPY